MNKDLMYRSLDSIGQTGDRLAKSPPEEPDASIAHVRVCEGAGRQRPGLLGNEKYRQDMLSTVFDALPSMIFVVDQDVRIQEYNAAASDLMMAQRKTILRRRAGELLHCLHSDEVAEGCGKAPFCEDCVIRNSVKSAFQGNRIVRRRTRIELLRDGDKTDIYALITASPFSFHKKPHALLVIEDISEIAKLQRMIPICSICKKVRDDKESWMQVETYFKNNWDIDFSHGYCPNCGKLEMSKMQTDNK